MSTHHQSTAARCAVKAVAADPESLVRFAELLKLRSLAPSTQGEYLRQLRKLAAHMQGDPAQWDEAWADEITIGSLTLTDVPVHEATPTEELGIQNYVGTLGMYALSRLDLMIDGKNAIAYLKPRPAPSPAYRPFNRPGTAPNAATGNWSVASSVRLNPKPMLATSYFYLALIDEAKDNAAGALTALTRVIELQPTNLVPYVERGIVRRSHGAYSGAIEIMHDTPWLRVRRSGQTAWEDLDTGENIHDFQAVGRGIADVFAHLDSGGVPQLASENALRATELIFATHESARRRGRVDLPLAPGPCALQAMIAAGEMSVDLPPT